MSLAVRVPLRDSRQSRAVDALVWSIAASGLLVSSVQCLQGPTWLTESFDLFGRVFLSALCAGLGLMAGLGAVHAARGSNTTRHAWARAPQAFVHAFSPASWQTDSHGQLFSSLSVDDAGQLRLLFTGSPEPQLVTLSRVLRLPGLIVLILTPSDRDGRRIRRVRLALGRGSVSSIDWRRLNVWLTWAERGAHSPQTRSEPSAELSNTMIKRTLSACLLSLSLVAASSLVAPPVSAQTARELPDFADLVERTGPAVVNIRTTARSRGGNPSASGPQMPEGMDDSELYDFFRRFMPPRQGPSPRGRGEGGGGGQGGPEVPRGVGSGFLISADGYLLTNHHVVEGADEIYVTLTDKREFKGKLIGSDRRTDVALVKIDSTGLPSLKIGDPIRLRVGEWVVAIGSPFGLDNTVTAGIVSAKGRDTGDYLPFIQTDVAVNPGNSGGPLINLRGEVIGINSQIYSRTGGFMGISFAIPIDEAMRVSDQLRATGRVTRGRIGVGIAEVTKDVAEPLGLPRAAGALVRNVEPAGPADKAGIEVGDIIQRFDGKPIERSSDLPRLVGNTRPGTKVPVTVWRKGASRELSLTVVEMQTEAAATTPGQRAQPPGGAGGAAAANALGLTVSELTDERKTQLRIKSGVLVDTVDGAAARAGIRPGDLILSLNNQDVTSTKQFNELVAKLDRAKNHVLLVRRGDSAQFVPIRPGN